MGFDLELLEAHSNRHHLDPMCPMGEPVHAALDGVKGWKSWVFAKRNASCSFF